MADIESGMVALVESKTEITDLIGSGVDCRFKPYPYPQGDATFPGADYRITNIEDRPTMDSPSKYDYAYFDIQIRARTRAECGEVWRAMRKALEYESGTYAGVDIDDVMYVPSGQTDFIEQQNIHTKLLELKVAYKRTP